MLLQKNEAKSKPGSRRIMKDNLDPAMLSAPMTHQPRCQLMSPIRHITRHGPSHRAPRTATSHATDRHTARHGSSCRRSLSATAVFRCIQTLGHAPLGRGSLPGKCAFCLWITGGKPVDNSCSPIGDFLTSKSYPHFVHRLSTGYPQVIHRKSTSYAI